jgi:hypothetical protein
LLSHLAPHARIFSAEKEDLTQETNELKTVMENMKNMADTLIDDNVIRKCARLTVQNEVSSPLSFPRFLSLRSRVLSR